jgi:hypothetical protein
MQTVAKTKRRLDTCMKSKRHRLNEGLENKQTIRFNKEMARKKNYDDQMKSLKKHFRELNKKFKEDDLHVEKQRELLSQTMEMKKEKNNWRFIDNNENNALLK